MKKLYRATEDKKIAGVCQGLAEYLNVDVNVVRLVTVMSALFGGFGLVFYIAAIFLIPEMPAEEEQE